MDPSNNLLDNPLDNLRDIHLPDPVSFWPPAPGWWLLIILSIVLLIAGYWAYRRITRPNVRKQALDELAQLNQQLGDGNYSKQFFIDASILIRRIAITVFGRKQVAGLAGEPWLKFLDKTSNTTFFTAGNGRLLVTAPYCDNNNIATGFNGDEVDIEQFSNEIKRWVMKNTCLI